VKTNVHFWSHFAHFLLEWEMFQTKVVEKIKTHILFSVTFFQKPCRLWDNVEKYCRAGQITDGNMAYTHCMLDNQGYKYTHSGCVIHIAFPHQQWLRERAQCYVIRTLPVLFYLHLQKRRRTVLAKKKNPPVEQQTDTSCVLFVAQ
jgi:hypothetical protein